MNSELLKALENRSVAILGAGTTATATGLMATLGLLPVAPPCVPWLGRAN